MFLPPRHLFNVKYGRTALDSLKVNYWAEMENVSTITEHAGEFLQQLSYMDYEGSRTLSTKHHVSLQPLEYFLLKQIVLGYL